MSFRVHDRVSSHLVPGGTGRVVRADRARDCYLVLADLTPISIWVPGESLVPAPDDTPQEG